MAELIWCDPLSVPLLQWLARGSLKQNLVQAIRLWVWLHLLYGKQASRLLLPEPFGYADWRDAFFAATHPKQDEKPTLHDRQCPCAKVTAAWLFGDRLSLSQSGWAKVLQQPDDHQQIQKRSQQFQQSLQQYDAVPDDLHMLLWQTRLFGVTRRTLASDLQRLADIGWVKRNGNRYERVHQFPTRPLAVMEGETEIRLATSDLAFLTQPDLAAIANNLAQDINGQQRFFVHLDYVVAQQQLDQVDEWQSVLRELWQRQTVPSILLPTG